MEWEKKGLIFKPDKTVEWMVAYATNPVAYHLTGNMYRVYFAGRNNNNQSSIGCFEIDITNPSVILNISKKPILTPGNVGYFDCDGVYPASILEINGQLYMYYIAWMKGTPEPLFHASIGLAISEDGGRTFVKYSSAPILDRNNVDPLLVSSPTVVKIADLFIMYYISGVRWFYEQDGLHSNYLIKEAYSQDGIHWERYGDIAIDIDPPNITNIARMSVIKVRGGMEGWYSYIGGGRGYRIGMAKSKDGKMWQCHNDEAGMQLSPTGWDSEAQAYPFVFLHKGCRYMLYNGNRFGYDGIGLAIEKR